MSDNIYSSPESNVIEEGQTSVTLSLKEILFSFKGRIRRSTYWYTMLGLFAIMFVVMMALALAGVDEGALGLIVVLMYIPLVWISLAVQVKRWHDRDKSGWWVLISFIPVIGGLWALIENGFLAGSPEVNRFGPPQA